MDKNGALGGSNRGVQQTGRNTVGCYTHGCAAGSAAFQTFLKPFSLLSLVSFIYTVLYIYPQPRNLCRDLFKLRTQISQSCYGCLHFGYRAAPSADLIPASTK